MRLRVGMVLVLGLARTRGRMCWDLTCVVCVYVGCLVCAACVGGRAFLPALLYASGVSSVFLFLRGGIGGGGSGFVCRVGFGWW